LISEQLASPALNIQPGSEAPRLLLATLLTLPEADRPALLQVVTSTQLGTEFL